MDQKTICGYVDEHGSKDGGSDGFSIQHVSGTGIYTIIFDPPLSTIPVVVATPVYLANSYSNYSICVNELKKNQITLVTATISPPEVCDQSFNFVAIG